MIDDRSQTTRQDSIRVDLHGLGAHHFSEPWELDTHDPTDRFRGDIARSNPSAASRQDQTAALCRERADCLLNPSSVIWHNRVRENLPACLLRRGLQRGTAQILVIPRAGAIRDGDDTTNDLHQAFVFSTSRTSAMCIFLSTALHMS